MAVSGKTLARTETLQSIPRDREMRSVWFDVELLAEGGIHKEASRDSSMSSHTGRSHSPTSRIPNRTDQDGIRGSGEYREVVSQPWTDVSDSRVGRRVFPSTSSGMENSPENETGGDGTRNTEECISSQHWRSRVRKPGTPQWTGRVPARSGADVTHRTGSGIHVDHNVETREHHSVSNTNPQCLIPESRHRVNTCHRCWQIGEPALESHIDGERRNRRTRQVGMKLTATLLFTFTQVCHEWNQSKIGQPYLDAVYASRVDVMEVGRPTNSVLINEISKMTGSSS